MSDLLERNVEKVVETITADEAKGLERMTQYRLSDLVREGRQAGIEKKVGGWTGANDSMCFLATAVTVAKAHGVEL